MKKIVLSLGLGLALTSGAFAADNNLDQLNSQIVNVLAPFQNKATVAQLAFGSLETNSERAVNVALNALYRKVGTQNRLEVKINNLSYNYDEGSAPTTILKGSFGIDITKILDQDQLNQMIPFAARMVEELATEFFGAQYGDAATFRAVITSTTKDANGNYTGLTALLSAKIDLTKLPANTSSKDVIATEALLSVSLDLKTGGAIDAFVISNPDYIGFKEGQEGLKEMLEKLISNDQETMAEIVSLAEKLDALGSSVIHHSNLLKFSTQRNLLAK